MTADSPATVEVLRARQTSWHQRLLTRVLMVVLLAISVSLGFWWWPRRTMLAVWYVNGTVWRDTDLQRADRILDWLNSIGVNSLAGYSDEVSRFLSSVSVDTEITGVELTDAKVTDEWLVHLKQFPNLECISLHDRQLGPSLEQLKYLKSLKRINVTSASKRHLLELNLSDHNPRKSRSPTVDRKYH